MNHRPKPGWIERTAESLGWINRLDPPPAPQEKRLAPEGKFEQYPPTGRWGDWADPVPPGAEADASRRCVLIPTTCFNCEAACGLLAYVDKERLEVRKFEGNPLHPGSRGRNCAKGPATINQIRDPDRILHPLKRVGPRGGGRWERVSWDAVLDDLAARIRESLTGGKPEEVMYHVGRAGYEGSAERVLKAWGIDGHNSHTNVCSAAARLGYHLWQGSDRPSPDHQRSRFILLMSSHLEAGHYFNPHAQRIIEGKLAGAKLAVIDPRLSNTAARADTWLAPYPGTEGAVLLAMANVLLEEGLFDRAYVETWVNWEEYLREEAGLSGASFDVFLSKIKEVYGAHTPEFAEAESGVPAATIRKVAREIGRAGSAFATHIWRGAASGHLGGWQIARALHFLSVLTGSVGTPGGTAPASWHKTKPAPFDVPPAVKFWNELIYPREYPFSHYEMSFLLPHFLKEGRGKLSVYFTRVYNPIWTNPDGFTWLEVLKDEEKIGLHAAMTPTWNESALYADYVLPMGLAGERHDVQSQETHSGVWVSFRQPVLRAAMERMGKPVQWTYEANPGEVWEEDEFWIELSWRIDPDGNLGIRRHFESPYRPGEKVTVEEYYRWMFENSVPGLPEKAAEEGLSPIEYMKQYGSFEIQRDIFQKCTRQLPAEETEGASIDPQTHVASRDGRPIGVEIAGRVLEGFPTPSRKLELFSSTLKDWGWPEHALPGYVFSHVREEDMGPGELILLPTFRLPTLIHTRSANAKWLLEISHRNPVWMHPKDSDPLGLKTGDLVKVHTEIGYFVNRVWVTESIRPGVIACSHHAGRWRLDENEGGGGRMGSALVRLEERQKGQWLLRQVHGVRPYESEDPDTARIWWQDPGVHQNAAFPVHPDPVSGMHCWHQKVRIEKAGPDDRYGDVFADTQKSFEIYREWLQKTRPAPGPGGLRRPLWLNRPIPCERDAYQLTPERPVDGPQA